MTLARYLGVASAILSILDRGAETGVYGEVPVAVRRSADRLFREAARPLLAAGNGSSPTGDLSTLAALLGELPSGSFSETLARLERMRGALDRPGGEGTEELRDFVRRIVRTNFSVRG